MEGGFFESEGPAKAACQRIYESLKGSEYYGNRKISKVD